MLTFYMSLADNETEKSLIEELYKINRRTMYAIAFSCLHNKADAEDAVHEAFVIAIKNIGKISYISANKQRSYLNVIVRNVSYAIYRKKNNEIPLDEEWVSEDITSAEDEALSNIGFEKLVDTIKQLPEGQRDAMYLRYSIELNTKETAESLAISEVAVRNRLFKARIKLKEMLEQELN